MAKITLNNLSHSYVPDYTDTDLVLRDINIDWKDGGAYALLGPQMWEDNTVKYHFGINKTV